MTRSTPPWMRSFGAVAAIAAAVLTAAAPARGDEPGQTEREMKAHRHFQRALQLSDSSRYAESLVELKRAYATAPHYKVLYNIGMVWVALERPVEAIEALEAYLSAGGASIDNARRAQVQQELRRQRSRVGVVRVELEPPDAILVVDGDPAKLGNELTLGAGVHHLTAVRGDGTATREVAIRGGESLSVRLAVDSSASAAESLGTGFVQITCGVQDMAVEVDGKPVGTTPLAVPIAVPAAAHRFEFSRPGYAAHAEELRVDAGSVQTLDCAAQPLAALPEAMSGQLAVLASVGDARIAVDGQPHRNGPVPVGRHRVDVTRDGYVPWSEEVVIQPGRERRLQVQLEPTGSWEDERGMRTRRRRIWAAALAGSAVGLGVAGMATLAASRNRFDTYLEVQDDLDDLLFAGLGNPALREAQQRNDQRLQDAHDLELVATGCLTAAGIALTSSAVLFVSSAGRRPERSGSSGLLVTGSSLVYRRSF